MNDKKERQKLPRFTYEVPEEIEDAFIEDMRRDIRLSASEQINAVLVQHYRNRLKEDALGKYGVRFSYGVPKIIEDQFIQDLKDQVREPAALVDAILVLHYREKARKDVLKANGQPGAEPPPPVPYYGPKPVRSKIDQDARQSGDE